MVNNRITAVILAGGLGRRLGGVDKGLVAVAGRPLVSYAIAAISPRCDGMAINSDNPEYARFGLPLLPDPLPDKPGPLAGVLAGVEYAGSDLLLTLPCDMPLLPPDLVERLRDGLERSGRLAASPSDGERNHPVIALYRRAAIAPTLRRYLETGGRRVGEWLASLDACVIDFSDRHDAFINANTPDDLRRIEAHLNHALPAR